MVLLNLKAKKYFILDLDGTLYKGSRVFPFARKFIDKLRATGRKPVFLTNNSSRSSSEYLQKLRKMGLARSSSEIYTSGLASIEFLLKQRIKKIFLLAAPAVEKEFKQAGFTLTENKPQAVVLTFDMTFTYSKFCQAYDLLMKGVPFFASHPDMHLPLEGDKFHPDIGTLIAAFTAAGCKAPTVIGKPQKHIYSQLQNHLKCQKSEMIMVGDRLYTDIKGANNFGIDTVLVLSGETTRKMLTAKSPRPSAVVANVGTLTSQL